MRLEHTPPYGNFPGEHGQVRYGEGVLMGYRWYEARGLPVRFPFGHGLSYTTFDVSSPDIDVEHIGVSALEAGAEVTVRVDVTNTGSRSGEHVVQLYVAPLSPSVVRPPQELKGFRKVRLAAGASTTVEIRLAARAFAHWDTGDTYRLDWRPQAAGTGSAVAGDRTAGHWRIDPGAYEIRVGSSSADVVGSALLVVSAD
jgi:beta-glucosidase